METVIIVAQEAFQKAGYQWVENIYNDDNEFIPKTTIVVGNRKPSTKLED